MEISLNQNFSGNAINVYSGSLQKTTFADSNVYINAEKIWGDGSSKKIIEAFTKIEIDIKIIRAELESKIDTKPVYNLVKINDIEETTNDCTTQYERSSFEMDSLPDIKKESSGIVVPCLNIPFDNNSRIYSSTNVSGDLKVYYISSTGEISTVIYSIHSQKHRGDKMIIFQAMSIGINNSLVITDEYEKKDKKNLGYDLRINGITNYSMHHVLPTMVVKNIITKEEMLKASKKLSTYTNRFVDEKFLIESLKNLDKFKNK